LPNLKRFLARNPDDEIGSGSFDALAEPLQVVRLGGELLPGGDHRPQVLGDLVGLLVAGEVVALAAGPAVDLVELDPDARLQAPEVVDDAPEAALVVVASPASTASIWDQTWWSNLGRTQIPPRDIWKIVNS
jgi:hypothetical protein